MFTTATSNVCANFHVNRLQQIMLAAYALVWIWAAINPVYPFDWFLENILTVFAVILLLTTYHYFPLSDLSYILIFVFLCLHAVGGHYTYVEVPLGIWLQETLELSRNHYDRIVHFCFGLLLAYPLQEAGRRFGGAKLQFSLLAALGFIFAGSANFEIIEMLVAMIVDPLAGQAYLGTQGDEWDGQKDMALSALGGVTTLALISYLRNRRA